MKLYFTITESDISTFTTFCKENSFSTITKGTYCLDNIEKSLSLIPDDKVPNNCLLKWDEDYIGKMYRNEIIGRFNQGKLQWTLMDSEAMAPMIKVLMYGMKKYDRDNWKKACPNRLDLMDSLQRHSLKIISGEAIDPESGLPHIGHLMCNAMFYSYWEEKTNGLFENYKEEPKQ